MPVAVQPEITSRKKRKGFSIDLSLRENGLDRERKKEKKLVGKLALFSMKALENGNG
jgi:hypothetical protein